MVRHLRHQIRIPQIENLFDDLSDNWREIIASESKNNWQLTKQTIPILTAYTLSEKLAFAILDKTHQVSIFETECLTLNAYQQICRHISKDVIRKPRTFNLSFVQDLVEKERGFKIKYDRSPDGECHPSGDAMIKCAIRFNATDVLDYLFDETNLTINLLLENAFMIGGIHGLIKYHPNYVAFAAYFNIQSLTYLLNRDSVCALKALPVLIMNNTPDRVIYDIIDTYNVHNIRVQSNLNIFRCIIEQDRCELLDKLLSVGFELSDEVLIKIYPASLSVKMAHHLSSLGFRPETIAQVVAQTAYYRNDELWKLVEEMGYLNYKCVIDCIDNAIDCGDLEHLDFLFSKCTEGTSIDGIRYHHFIRFNTISKPSRELYEALVRNGINFSSQTNNSIEAFLNLMKCFKSKNMSSQQKLDAILFLFEHDSRLFESKYFMKFAGIAPFDILEEIFQRYPEIDLNQKTAFISLSGFVALSDVYHLRKTRGSLNSSEVSLVHVIAINDEFNGNRDFIKILDQLFERGLDVSEAGLDMYFDYRFEIVNVLNYYQILIERLEYFRKHGFKYDHPCLSHLVSSFDKD